MNAEELNISKKEMRKIERECRAIAHDMVQQQYALYDEIWYGRIRLGPAVEEHGKEIVKELVRIMPNLLVRSGTACPADLVAERYGFETTSDLIDYLLAYTPRGPKEDHIYGQLLEEKLSEFRGSTVDEIPF